MNKSLEAFWQLADQLPHMKPDPEIQKFLEALMEGEIIESVNVRKIQDMWSCSYWFSVRDIIGYVSPTLAWAKAVKKVVQNGSVLEVGAGTGLVAKYLKEAGIQIIATDNFNWFESEKTKWKLFFDVERLDYREAIRKYRTDYLLLCWPYMDSLAWEASKLFTELNPDGKILYIGEPHGGCTADDTFFEGIEILDTLDEVNSLYPQWDGLHDCVWLVKWTGNQSETDKWESIEIVAKEMMDKNPSWRHGQSLFNALYFVDSETANKIRGTCNDCFHSDSKIPNFKEATIEIWTTEA